MGGWREVSNSGGYPERVVQPHRPGRDQEPPGHAGARHVGHRRGRGRHRRRRHRRDAPGHDRPRLHHQRPRRPARPGHRGRAAAAGLRPGRQRLRPHVPDAPGREDRHPQQSAGEDPGRPVDGLHARGRSRVPRHQGGPREGLRAHDQAERRRRRDRRYGRPRAGEYRARGGAAGDGGQVAPLQGVRRDRRLPDLPGDDRGRPDRGNGPAHRPGLRGDQSRGHLGAPVLRGGRAAVRRAGHPRVPRRPARHRGGGPGGPAERPAPGAQGAAAAQGGRVRGGRGGHGDDPHPAEGGRRPHRGGGRARHPGPRAPGAHGSGQGRGARETNPPTSGAGSATRWRAPTCSSACPPRAC